ncbi:UNVERIFIED_CONTAM: hypothetical protein K2H54_075383 [Gekko kuhli]
MASRRSNNHGLPKNMVQVFENDIFFSPIIQVGLSEIHLPLWRPGLPPPQLAVNNIPKFKPQFILFTLQYNYFNFYLIDIDIYIACVCLFWDRMKTQRDLC